MLKNGVKLRSHVLGRRQSNCMTVTLSGPDIAAAHLAQPLRRSSHNAKQRLIFFAEVARKLCKELIRLASQVIVGILGVGCPATALGRYLILALAGGDGDNRDRRALCRAARTASVSELLLQAVNLAIAAADVCRARGTCLGYEGLGAGNLVLEAADSSVCQFELGSQRGFGGLADVDLALGFGVLLREACNVVRVSQVLGSDGS